MDTTDQCNSAGFLFRIDVAHYGPKSSHDSIECYVVAPDHDRVIKWLADEKNAMWGNWSDDDDDTTGSVSPVNKWWDENPHKRQQAIDMGLTIGKYGDVEGDRMALLRWWQGDIDEPEDCYYGVTQYSWTVIDGATASDIDTLVRLGIATVI